MENLSSESPYIGKSRQKRIITFASDNKRERDLKQDLTETDNPASDDLLRHAQLRGTGALCHHNTIKLKNRRVHICVFPNICHVCS